MRLRTRYTHRLPVAPGLRLDMPMFEGSGAKVLDVSGKGNHGTITDAVWTRDENGVAMSFNGTSAYIDCGNDASLNITDAITIEAWVKANSQVVYDGIITKSTSPAWNDGYGIYLTATEVRFWVSIYSGNVAYKILDADDGNWHHIVGTYDKNVGQVRIFVVGVEGTSDNFSGDITTTSHVLEIGRGIIDAYNLNGAIDEVRIYAVALTAEQIKRRYEQTKRDYVRGS